MKKLLYVILLFGSTSLLGQGTELINNGDFSSSVGWDVINYSISGGVASFNNAGIGDLRQTDANLVSSVQGGTSYTISFEVSDSANMTIFSTNAIQYVPQSTYYPGRVYEFQFTTPASVGDGGIRFYTYNDYGTFDIDNISLIENYPQGDDPYYVSTTGNDYDSGTFTSPFRTWQRAANISQPGDTTYIRGGIYTKPLSINAADTTMTTVNGAADAYICLLNYPGETPIMDLANYPPTGVYNQGITMSYTTYWRFEGLTIRNVWQREVGFTAEGISAYGCSNTDFIRMTVHNIGGRAVGWFGGFGNYDPNGSEAAQSIPDVPADTSRFINCDFYDLCDTLCNNTDPVYCETYYSGGIADGIKWNNEAGAYLLIDGCRVWNHSDNGFDPNGEATIVIRNSWTFNGGHFNYEGWVGEGSGIKYGNQLELDTVGILRSVINCISANNNAAGFDENNSREGFVNIHEHIYNNVSYNNQIGWTNISRGEGTQTEYFRNNLSYQDTDGGIAGFDLVNINSVTNSWDDPPGVTVSSSDFTVTLDSAAVATQLLQDRQSDGSLPEITVFKLDSNSGLKGAGTDVGMSTTPDIGIDWDYLGASTPSTPSTSRSKSLRSGGKTQVWNGKRQIISFE